MPPTPPEGPPKNASSPTAPAHEENVEESSNRDILPLTEASEASREMRKTEDRNHEVQGSEGSSDSESDHSDAESDVTEADIQESQITPVRFADLSEGQRLLVCLEHLRLKELENKKLLNHLRWKMLDLRPLMEGASEKIRAEFEDVWRQVIDENTSVWDCEHV